MAYAAMSIGGTRLVLNVRREYYSTVNTMGHTTFAASEVTHKDVHPRTWRRPGRPADPTVTGFGDETFEMSTTSSGSRSNPATTSTIEIA